MAVQVFILHWAGKESNLSSTYNEALLNCIRSIRRVTEIPHEITIIYDCEPEFLEDLKRKAPEDVKLVEDYRKRGASGARNVALDLAEGYFFILDNDMKVNRGWLENLLVEVESAEKYFGSPCAITPSYMPYLEEGSITSGKYGNVLSQIEMTNWCRNYGIPMEDEDPRCKTPFVGSVLEGGTGVTDSGWRLSNFIAHKSFFDEVGYSDEDLCGWWGEDMEWAYRAFQTDCKLLESHTVFVQHIMNLTSGQTSRIKNAEAMVNKLGKEVYEGMLSGDIWKRLRRNQKERRAKKGYSH